MDKRDQRYIPSQTWDWWDVLWDPKVPQDYNGTMGWDGQEEPSIYTRPGIGGTIM